LQVHCWRSCAPVQESRILELHIACHEQLVDGTIKILLLQVGNHPIYSKAPGILRFHLVRVFGSVEERVDARVSWFVRMGMRGRNQADGKHDKTGYSFHGSIFSYSKFELSHNRKNDVK